MIQIIVTNIIKMPTSRTKLKITNLHPDIFDCIIKYIYPFKFCRCYTNNISGDILSRNIYVNKFGGLHDFILSNKKVLQQISPKINKMRREYYLSSYFQEMYSNWNYYKICERESKTLKKMVDKLIIHNIIYPEGEWVKKLDFRSLEHFINSIYWGESYRLDDEWLDMLAPAHINTEISIWEDEDEIDMVDYFNEEFKAIWFRPSYSPEFSDEDVL